MITQNSHLPHSPSSSPDGSKHDSSSVPLPSAASTAEWEPLVLPPRISPREALRLYRDVRDELALYREGEVGEELLSPQASLVLRALPSFREIHERSPTLINQTLEEDLLELPLGIKGLFQLGAVLVRAVGNKEDAWLTRSLGWHLGEIAGRGIATVTYTAAALVLTSMLQVSPPLAVGLATGIAFFGMTRTLRNFYNFVQAGALRHQYVTHLQAAITEIASSEPDKNS